LEVRINDSFGKRRTIEELWRPNSDLGAKTQLLIDRTLSDLSAEPPFRAGLYKTGAIPVTVFVASPAGAEPGWAEGVVRKLMGEHRAHFQLVRLPQTKALRREPFQLPFRILADTESAPALNPVQAEPWFLTDMDLNTYGLTIEATPKIEEMLGRFAWDVVFTADPDKAIHVARRLPPSGRPRLIVGLEKAFPVTIETLPRGTAYVASDGSSPQADSFVQELTYGFMHDLPLDEAVKVAEKQSGQSGSLIIADPVSNQYLRMRDALVTIKQKGERLQTSLPILAFDALTNRLPFKEDPDVRRFIKAVEPYRSTPIKLRQLHDWASSVEALPEAVANFERETTGLVPLSRIEAAGLDILSQEHEVRGVGIELTSDPAFANILRQHQNRQVDIALQRLQSDPLMTMVDKKSTLAAFTEYQIRLHIGQRLKDSIVAGTPPPLDPLLPDPEDAQGYVLEVVVQAKQFRMISEPLQSLRLPLFGGTEPLYFRVHTPKQEGAAELRICIYHKTHMLQAFLVSAQITSSEQTREADVLEAVLEFSRTQTFANVGDFQPRALSIGVNATGGTHELLIKSTGANQEYTFFPVAYDSHMKKFRDELANAVRDPADPRRPRSYPIVPPGAPPSPEVAHWIRSWARIGRDLYDALLTKTVKEDVKTDLFGLKSTHDQKIQVVRFDETFVFPWVLLYDFGLPEEIAGAPPEPVCLGYDAQGNQCTHAHTDHVFCVNGFWGIRHYVEELLRCTSETAPKVPRQSQKSVRLIADPQLNESGPLGNDLLAEIGAQQFEPGPNDRMQLLDLLWDPAQRPSLLIFLAHLETQQIQNQPTQPRLVLDQNQWLTQQNITTKSSQFPKIWAQPRSVVFLMACESATMDIQTINNFVTAWIGCGAAAILGTEAVIGSDLAAQFALETGKKLWNQGTLGQAVTEFRRSLIHSGNVLAFVFQSIGDVDLTIQ